MGNRNKQHHPDSSLKQSLPGDMTFVLDLICELFHLHFIQFLILTNSTQNISSHCRITIVMSFSHKKYYMIQIHQRSCCRMTKFYASHPPRCVPENEGSRWKNLPSTPYLKKCACSENTPE